jgi:hypothetical protein
MVTVKLLYGVRDIVPLMLQLIQSTQIHRNLPRNKTGNLIKHIMPLGLNYTRKAYQQDPRTFGFEKQKCVPGHKSSKEQLVVISCGNGSRNHKMKFVPTEKTKKSQLFNDTKANCIPAHYYNQKQT